MSDQDGIEIEEYDLRGLQCPLPVLKTRNRMRKMDVDERFWVLTDDPLAGLDIPNFCNEYGQELMGQKSGDGEDLYFLIKRTNTKL